MKIAIVGNSGSGKSTFTYELHRMLNIPLYYLDQHFWKPGWQRPDRSKFARIHHELCDRDSWIIEGMAIRYFDYRAERADIIIFLDIPLWRCLYRIFKRAIFCYGQVRDSSAKRCSERMPNQEFLRYVWKFNQKQKLVIQELLEKYKNTKKIFVIRNNKERNELLDKVGLREL